MLKKISSILYVNYIVGCLIKRKSKGFKIILIFTDVTVAMKVKLKSKIDEKSNKRVQLKKLFKI